MMPCYASNTGSNFKINTNLGVFREECKGDLINKKICLRPKLYSYKINDQERRKKVFLIQCLRNITFGDYKTCYFQNFKKLKKWDCFRLIM